MENGFVYSDNDAVFLHTMQKLPCCSNFRIKWIARLWFSENFCFSSSWERSTQTAVCWFALEGPPLKTMLAMQFCKFHIDDQNYVFLRYCSFLTLALLLPVKPVKWPE